MQGDWSGVSYALESLWQGDQSYGRLHLTIRIISRNSFFVFAGGFVASKLLKFSALSFLIADLPSAGKGLCGSEEENNIWKEAI